MPELTRQVSWGDALVVEQFRYPGGLKAAVQVIQQEIGTHIGVRGTFQKLLRVTDPDTLAERDRFRAWLLLATFGQDPGGWGIRDDVVPRSFDSAALRETLAALRDTPRYIVVRRSGTPEWSNAA